MLRRHAKSFVKGATTGSAAGDAAQPADPAAVLAKATRMIRRVMALQLVWFVMCIAGALMLLVDLVRGGSLALPALFFLGGFVGLCVTGYIATRLAAKYLGAGANAFLRSQGRAGRGRGGVVVTTTATEQPARGEGTDTPDPPGELPPPAG